MQTCVRDIVASGYATNLVLSKVCELFEIEAARMSAPKSIGQLLETELFWWGLVVLLCVGSCTTQL